MTPVNSVPSVATTAFEVKDLHVCVEGEPILQGLNLSIKPGETHAIMGPNGSGKSTFGKVVAGDPTYEITQGSITLNGDDITGWDPDIRAQQGVFLAFQYPQAIPGVTLNNFLQQAVSARRGEEQSVLGTRRRIMEWMQKLEMDAHFAERFLNEGFSGGEKKRAEVLQMAMLEPNLAVLDETDSGLDVDALRVVAKGVGLVREQRPEMASIVITHYQRLLDLIKPDFVHIFLDGKIVASGGMELAERLEQDGYESLK